MSFGGAKDYRLVLLDFSENKYRIFVYQKDRRLTAKQAWQMIYNTSPVIEGDLSSKATIYDYDNILEKHSINPKYSDRYMIFRSFNK